MMVLSFSNSSCSTWFQHLSVIILLLLFQCSSFLIQPRVTTFVGQSQEQKLRNQRWQYVSNLFGLQRRELSQAIRLSGDSSDDKGLEAMRKILEASWNTEAMGVVPTDPQNAAEAAAIAVSNAMDRGHDLLLIEILLPSYDITQGTNLYDEVLAVQFCIELAKCMQESGVADISAVLVKNGIGERSVGRVLNMKEREQQEAQFDEEKIDSSIQQVSKLESFADDNVNYDPDDDDDENEDNEGNSGDETKYFDDDFDGIGSVGLEDDIDLFRQKLSSSWDDSESYTVPKARNSSEEKGEDMQAMLEPSEKVTRPNLVKPYRIGSLFGDAEISNGPDMFDDAVAAVDRHAVRETDEALIVLSAVSKEEMVAVRRLVGLYEGKKPIVLVNCKLDPMPRELLSAETVYSVLPLIARPTTSEGNIFGQANQSKEKKSSTEQAAPKVVVLRRFPRDWEVYVDVDGAGFELVDTAPAIALTAKGPSMSWIAGCVKRHLQFKIESGDV